jgi:MFS family permease
MVDRAVGSRLYAQIVITLIGFSSFVGLSIVIPVLPHYATAYGATAFGATFAFAISAIVAMVSGIFWGRMSDRFGRKPIVIISLLGTMRRVSLARSSELTRRNLFCPRARRVVCR